jgi:hypothetical protein
MEQFLKCVSLPLSNAQGNPLKACIGPMKLWGGYVVQTYWNLAA